MKMLFVSPPLSTSERFSNMYSEYTGNHIPLGLYYLASYIRNNGHEADVIDVESTHTSVEDIINRIKNDKFNVLGITCTTLTFNRALDLAKTTKKLLPKVTIIIGGPHVSSTIEETLQHKVFDYIVYKEGEESLLELLNALEHNKKVTAIKGIAYRSNNKIKINQPREVIKNIDEIPLPAYDLIPDISIYHSGALQCLTRPVANIVTSRGCPNLCTFCDRTVFGEKVRLRTAENVVDEIELLIKKYKIKEICFMDDTFTMNKERVYKIINLIRERKLKFSWSCMTRINRVDEELLKYMKANGCWFVSFGLESGDENILKKINKKIQLEDVRRVTDLCAKVGIHTKGFFIIGHPTETVETINKTIEFATSIKLNQILVGINTPLPGTEQYINVDKYGTLDKTSWSNFSLYSPVFVPHGLTKEILLQKYQEFNHRFYARRSIQWQIYKIIFTSRYNFKIFLANLKKSLLCRLRLAPQQC